VPKLYGKVADEAEELARKERGIKIPIPRAGMYALAPNVLNALKIVKPETVLRWHRAGFRAYSRWKSRPRGGRPSTPAEIRDLIREMRIANPLWGAPRIHGELLKLGIDVGQTTVAKYMAKTKTASRSLKLLIATASAYPSMW
jgi:hypothetical protein